MLDERKIVVLQTLIEQYIATGEPVSSAAIAQHSGLGVSTATIRNDLTSLEAEGYLLQPHTSAGRLPTAKGYRYYVDHSEPGHLRRGTQNRINTFFSSVQLELSRLLKATTELVADETTYPAVVLGPGLGGDRGRAPRSRARLFGRGGQPRRRSLARALGHDLREVRRLGLLRRIEGIEIAVAAHRREGEEQQDRRAHTDPHGR